MGYPRYNVIGRQWFVSILLIGPVSLTHVEFVARFESVVMRTVKERDWINLCRY
jgi:hypothetical protein